MKLAIDRTKLVERLQIVGILAIGFVFMLVYAYPGFMSYDSLSQLAQARDHNYGDWHPPTMSAIWTVTELFVKGPAGMLVLQTTTFLAGLYLLARRVASPRIAAVIAVALFMFPPIFTTMACIWKDSLMAGFLMLGTGLLLSERRWPRIVGLLLFVLASAVRHNAAAATFAPLVLLFRWNDAHRWLKRGAIAAVIWVLTVGSAQLINKALTKRHEHVWYVALGPYDVLGVLRYSRPYPDEELRHLFEGGPFVRLDHIQEFAKANYNPYNWYYFSVPGRVHCYDWPVNDQQRAAVQHAWSTLVRDNPKAYFQHRVRVFRGVIGLTGGLPLFDPVHAAHGRIETWDFEEVTGVQAALSTGFRWIATETPLYLPYWYLLALLILAGIAIWRRNALALALLASGFLYELSFFPLAVSSDNRYSHWMIAMVMLATAQFASRRLTRMSQLSPPIDERRRQTS